MFPTTCLTHGSILRSPTHSKHIKQFLLENEHVKTLPLTDICSVTQCVDYVKALKSIDKKPVLGCQIPLCDNYSEIKEENPTTNQNAIFYCHNLDGWKELLKILLFCNDPTKILGSIRISPLELEAFNLDNLSVVLPQAYRKFLNSKKDFVAYEQGYSENFPALTIGKNAILYESHLDRLQTVVGKDKGLDSEDKSRWSQDACVSLTEDMFADNSMRLLDMVEEFDITHPEELPPFSDNDDELLKKKCWEGLKRIGKDQDQTYIDRVRREMEVMLPKGFSGYFLIMSDITNYCMSNGKFIGCGRGSAGGCLISYLANIITLDPIEHDLMFERFYNPDKTDTPDIDLDVQPSFRPQLVDYLENKYGKDKFAQLSTFGTIKGAGALKLCLSKAGMSFGAQNLITELLPMEAKVDPELADQLDGFGTRSLVLYSLRKYPDKFAEWAKIDKETNEISGPYAKEFQLAINLDHTIVSEGKHASAFILCKNNIVEQAPLRYDNNSKRLSVAVDMGSSSDLGLVKLDLLGLTLLDKAKSLQESMFDGSIYLKKESWKDANTLFTR